MGYDIEVAETAEQPTAVVALATTWPELPAEAGAFDDVWAFLRLDGQERLRSDGYNVILYKDGVPHAEGVIVTEAFDDAGRVTASVLPGATVARTVHRGLHEHLADAHQAVHPGAPTTATA